MSFPAIPEMTSQHSRKPLVSLVKPTEIWEIPRALGIQIWVQLEVPHHSIPHLAPAEEWPGYLTKRGRESKQDTNTYIQDIDITISSWNQRGDCSFNGLSEALRKSFRLSLLQLDGLSVEMAMLPLGLFVLFICRDAIY